MGDFSLVKDQRGVFRGIWLRNPDEANDLYFLKLPNSATSRTFAYLMSFPSSVLSISSIIIPV